MLQQDPADNSELRLAQRRAIYSVLLNSLLALAKGVFAVKANSTALLGDAIHSATDVVASLVAFAGLSLARKQHPSFNFGLYKAETLATLVISLFIIIAGYELGRQALFGSSKIPDVSIALPVSLVCFIVALLFGIFQVREGKRLGSPVLVADGKDYLADCFSTAVVIFSLACEWMGFRVDRWAAAIVAIFVIRTGVILLFNAFRELMDVAIDRETEDEIRKLVLAQPGVVGIQRFLSRMAGGKVILNLDVDLKTKSHEKADRICDRLEEEIVRRFPQVVMAGVRPHFHDADEFVRIIPLEGPDKGVSSHFAKAPWFLVERKRRSDGGLIQRKFIKNPFLALEKRRGVQVGKWLLNFAPDEVYMPDNRKAGAIAAILEEAGVAIRPVSKIKDLSLVCAPEDKE